MDRRRLLKTMALSAGYVIAAPTLTQLLVACNAESNINWKPLFLNDMQAFVVEQIANILLPKSDSPSALDVNTPQFLDLILNDIVSKDEQYIFVKGSEVFQSKFIALFDKNVLKGTQKDFSEIIAKYFIISKKEEKQMFEMLNSNDIDVTATDTYYLYKYFLFIKRYTFFAYYTSEEVANEVLKFDPYTGTYKSCIPASELGII